jgi:hypothetical protein
MSAQLQNTAFLLLQYFVFRYQYKGPDDKYEGTRLLSPKKNRVIESD